MSIRMKPLKDFRGRPGEGNTRQDDSLVIAGPEIDVASEHRAAQLEARGLAVTLLPVTAEVVRVASDAQVHPDNKAAQDGPFDSVGGETGAESPPSSSGQDRPLQKRRSRKPEGGLDL